MYSQSCSYCAHSRTKIVCTLGPASSDIDTIRQLIHAGMDVARINFSHGTYHEHGQQIATCRRLANELGVTIGILADLQGPKLRIGTFASGSIDLKPQQEFTLTKDPIIGDSQRVSVPNPELVDALSEGKHVILGDGDIELIVTHIEADGVHCQVVAGGLLSGNKGITVPGVYLPMPVITDKDREDLTFALAQDVDFIALSFVQCASDIEALRQLIRAAGKDTAVIAKIERVQAVEQCDAIITAADGIMVARGDLGLEAPPEEVPMIQKALINKARLAGKPVITATQMLESMIVNPRPTRAEASDVANAIIDGSDAVMLSGETAVGKYPAAAVTIMCRIAQETERHLPYSEWAYQTSLRASSSITEAISQATCEIATELQAKAIIAATMSGLTARMVAKNRPQAPVLAVTPNKNVVRRLSLSWGVIPVLVPHYDSTDAITAGAVACACNRHFLQPQDLVVLTAGVPMGGTGRTNMIRVHYANEVFKE